MPGPKENASDILIPVGSVPAGDGDGDGDDSAQITASLGDIAPGTDSAGECFTTG